MARRTSFEAKALDWVDTAPLTVVNTILPIMQARAKVRNLAEGAKVNQAVTVKRRKSRKVNARAVETPAQAEVVA